MSPPVFRGTSLWPKRTMSSIFSSSSSESLKPWPLKILMPLCSKGLWLAEMTMPASAFSSTVTQATPGVGRVPRSSTSAPAVHSPR